MTDEFELLCHFRDEMPDPSTDAWTRARSAIAVAAAEEIEASTRSVTTATRQAADVDTTRSANVRGRSQVVGFHRPRIFLVQSALVCTVLLAAVLISVLNGSASLSGPLHTPWSASHALPVSRSHVQAPKGTWLLADSITKEGWQRNTTGPEPGNLTCPTSSTCYVTGDNATSSSGPAKYDSFYVSHDGALSWSVLPVPAGVYFTTALSCASAQSCAAGATYNSRPVFITTSDGGHSFTIDPLPGSNGALYSLDCPSLGFCAGLAATSVDYSNTPIDATFLSTANNGASFADTVFPSGQSMDSLACPTSSDCVAVGTLDASSTDAIATGVVAHTNDGGQSWTSGALPVGFGIINYSTRLSCSDAEHCSVLGAIAVTITNQPACSTMTPPTSSSPPQSSTAQQSPAVQAIARQESAYWANASAAEAKAGIGECVSGGNGSGSVSDIAQTSDGGLTWVPEALPSSAPEPILGDIVCASNTDCVATGTVAVPQRFPSGALNGGSAIVLVTHDDGATWTGVSFAVPANVSGGVQSDAFMAVGEVQCPQVNDCVALGVSDQGSNTTPVYTGGLIGPAASNA
ncbi:MAG TPA: hypothetical protein VMU68_07665 [Acidimicrobiales bacterium]|nr:hypothetical protein [Acidimicrobiales bacterium]